MGRWYESRARRRLLSGSSAGGIGRESEEEGEEEGRGDDLSPFLLDPTQWKVYTLSLLGLSVYFVWSASQGSRSLPGTGTWQTEVSCLTTGHQEGLYVAHPVLDLPSDLP